MKIFNFRINETSLQFEKPLRGNIKTVEFMVRFEKHTLKFVQAVDEHSIYLVNSNNKLVYQHNFFDGLFSELDKYLSEEELKSIPDFWFVNKEVPNTPIKPSFPELNLSEIFSGI